MTGFEREDLVVGNGSASEPQGNNATYTATVTPEASGTVTVDIAAGAAQDRAGNPSAAADQFSIVADLDPGAGSAGGRRDRACSATAVDRRSTAQGDPLTTGESGEKRIGLASVLVWLWSVVGVLQPKWAGLRSRFVSCWYLADHLQTPIECLCA